MFTVHQSASWRHSHSVLSAHLLSLLLSRATDLQEPRAEHDWCHARHLKGPDVEWSSQDRKQLLSVFYQQNLLSQPRTWNEWGGQARASMQVCSRLSFAKLRRGQGQTCMALHWQISERQAARVTWPPWRLGYRFQRPGWMFEPKMLNSRGQPTGLKKVGRLAVNNCQWDKGRHWGTEVWKSSFLWNERSPNSGQRGKALKSLKLPEHPLTIPLTQCTIQHVQTDSTLYEMQ